MSRNYRHRDEKRRYNGRDRSYGGGQGGSRGSGRRSSDDDRYRNRNGNSGSGSRAFDGYREETHDHSERHNQHSYNNNPRPSSSYHSSSDRRAAYEQDLQEQTYGTSGHYGPARSTHEPSTQSSMQRQVESAQIEVRVKEEYSVPAPPAPGEQMEIDQAETNCESDGPMEKRAKLLDGQQASEQRTTVTHTMCSIMDVEAWSKKPLTQRIKEQMVGGMDFHIRRDIERMKGGTHFLNETQWMKQKVDAAALALESIQTHVVALRPKTPKDHVPLHSDCDSMDDDDSADGHFMYGDRTLEFKPHGKDNYHPKALEKFVRALPFNVIFDAGFIVPGIHPDDEKHCYCPCSKHMRNWRKKFDLCVPIGNDACESFKKNSPDAFMAHIESESSKGGILHRAVELYVRALYANYWGASSPMSAGVDHKGLHKVSTPRHVEALSAEKRYYVEAMDSYKAEIQRRDKELARRNDQIAALSRLEAINTTLADEFKDLQENFSALKIKEEENVKKEEANVFLIKPKLEEIEDEIASYRSPVHSILCDLKLKISPDADNKCVEFRIPQSIVIQDLFDNWYNAELKDPTYLMRDLLTYTKTGKQQKDVNTEKVLWPWNIKIDKALDHGGLTRAFISAFNDQMGYLSIAIDISKDIISSVKQETMLGKRQLRVKLFDQLVSGSFVPIRDVSFDNNVDKKALECGIASHEVYRLKREIKDKAKKFYRAIGRMFVHIICNQEKNDERNEIEVSTISLKLLPEMLRNVLLRGVYPGTPSYDKKELTIDIRGMDENGVFKILKDGGLSFEDVGLGGGFLQKHDGCLKKEDLINNETFDRFLPLYILKTRDVAISGLQEGITLGGKINLQSLFAIVPSRVINVLLFSNPEISAQQVIDFLEPKYSSKELVDDKIVGAETVRKVMKDNQERCFTKDLPDVLRDLSSGPNAKPNFLQDFLKFCTGSSYMPYLGANPNFRILVSFSCSLRNDSLPTANTCFNTFNIPANAYLNDKNVLREKISQMIAACNVFTFK